MKWSGSVMFNSLQPHELYVACQAPPPMAFSRQDTVKLHTNENGIYIYNIYKIIKRFSSVQLLSRVRHFETPWTAARQASLSITNSRSLLQPMAIESVMPPNHLILCGPLLLLPSIFPESGSFPMNWFFASGGQSIGVSASTSVLPVNI